MKKLVLLTLFNFLFLIPRAQIPPKVEDKKLIGDDCYYLKQLPKNGKFLGVLVLIPGYGEHPYSVSAQTSIIQEADRNGIAVIMVNLTPNNQDFPIDSNSIAKLGEMIRHFYKQENIPSTAELYLGGFSIGGTTALKFFSEQNRKFKIKKIFAIDPPLDMIRLRKSLSKGRDKYLVGKLDTLTKGAKH